MDQQLEEFLAKQAAESEVKWAKYGEVSTPVLVPVAAYCSDL